MAIHVRRGRGGRLAKQQPEQSHNGTPHGSGKGKGEQKGGDGHPASCLEGKMGSVEGREGEGTTKQYLPGSKGMPATLVRTVGVDRGDGASSL